VRVLLVHNDYARPSGEEHACESIARLLEERGHCVTWFGKSSAGIPGSLAGKTRAFFSGIHSFRSRREMAELLRGSDFDIVQVQNLYPLLSPSILAPVRRRGIPIVMRCPNYRLFCPTGLLLSGGRLCEKCMGTGGELWCVLKNCAGSLPKSLGYALRNAFARITGMIRENVAVFVVLSEFQRRRFIDRGIPADRVEVVPNMIAGSALAPPAEPGEGSTISFVGRLSPEKGIADFLAAARALPELRFAVAGDASAMPEAVAGAPPNVLFHGFLSGERLAEFYRETRILVCCSKWFEGFPNVLVEAMCAGRPVVATRIGALPEIVEEGVTGLLYEPGNVPQLVERLRRLWAEPGLCREMGMAGRQKATTEYSRDRCYERLMWVYQKALALGRAEAP